MANTLITPTELTRESLRVLHQKLNFIGSIDRQYDDKFARSGAKIGSTIQIRKPNQFVVRSGRALDVQDVTEEKVDLTVNTQKGVDMSFTSEELTMDLDRLSERYLEPAMAVLAARMESDAMTMYKDVYNEISDVGAAVVLDDVLESSKVLTDNLTNPATRTLNLNTRDNVDLVSALTGLFNPQSNISSNFRQGMVANQFVGYRDVFENTLWPIHTTGTDDGTGDYLVNDTGTIAEGSTSITVDTGAGTWKKGDIFYFASVNRVHPETKEDTGILHPFVIAADVAASATTITFSPALYSSGAKQNVSAMPANNAALSKLESDRTTAVGASADYKISLGYAKEAFTFATADLIMPDGVDFAARETMDGLSMRVVRQYDINSDALPLRIDVLYGFVSLRPELAVRLGFN